MARTPFETTAAEPALHAPTARLRVVYGAAVTGGVLLILGSLGFRAITGDHHQYLLPVLRAADPSFTAGDWFTSQTTPYHYTFQALLSLAARFDAVVPALIAIHILTLAALCGAIAWLGHRLGAPWWSLVPVLFVLRFGIQTTWGDVNLLGVTALPHYAGLALAFATIAAVFARRYPVAAGFLAATVYVHVSVGAWTGVVVAAMLAEQLHRRQVGARDLIRPFLGLGIAILPLAFVVAGDFMTPGVDPEAYRILFDLRAPHHYSFADLGASQHLRMALVVAVALVTESLGRYQDRGLRTAVLVVVAIGLVGAFFLHVVYWPLPVRLFPYRLAPLATGLAAVLAGALATRPDVAGRERAVGVAALLGLLAVWRTELWEPIGAAVAAHPAASASVLVLTGATATVTYRSRPRGLMHGRDIAPALAVPTIAAVTVLLVMGQPPSFSLRWLTEQQEAFGVAVRDLTPPGSILVTPPDAEYVRLATERGVVVDFKSFPMVATEMEEWRDRLEDVSGVPMPLDGPGGVGLRNALAAGYRRQPRGALEAAGERYGATFLVVHEGSVAAQELSRDPSATYWPIGDHVLAEVTESDDT